MKTFLSKRNIKVGSFNYEPITKKELLESEAFKNASDNAPIFISDCITVCVPLRYLSCIDDEIILELEHYNEPC